MEKEYINFIYDITNITIFCNQKITKVQKMASNIASQHSNIIQLYGSRFDGFSIGIYHINPKNDIPFSRNELVIYQNERCRNMTEAFILRDIDFSFVVKNKSIFKIGLFAFHPKHITYSEIKSYYAKNKSLPRNGDVFEDFGIYDINFDLSSLIFESDTHFMVKHNFMKFQFYFMKLDRNAHQDIYHRYHISENSDELLYYISNPIISFDIYDL